jgi:hypothetical protein
VRSADAGVSIRRPDNPKSGQPEKSRVHTSMFIVVIDDQDERHVCRRTDAY